MNYGPELSSVQTSETKGHDTSKAKATVHVQEKCIHRVCIYKKEEQATTKNEDKSAPCSLCLFTMTDSSRRRRCRCA
jgi:hypothetical protein